LIYALSQWLDPEAETYLRLGFKYVSFRAGLSFIFAWIFTLLFLPRSFSFLSRKGWVNRQRTYMIDSSSKEGTPLMGGAHLFIASTFSILLFTDLSSGYVSILLLGGTIFFILGLLDDIMKIRGGHADAGVSRGIKYAVQIGFGLILGFYLIGPWSPHPEALRGTLALPFSKIVWHIEWFTLPITVIIVVFIANAVNFADGMDGLASGPCIFTFLGLGIFAYILGHAVWSAHFLFFQVEDQGLSFLSSSELVVVCAAIMGALMGFLWYNTYPATIFMGDCGSMYLGGTMAIIFVLIKQEMLFLSFGFFFVIEIFSVFIQDYIGIKLLGRRIFYRAPYHENLKFLGYSEPKIVIRMWILSAVTMSVGLLSLKIR
jgi:phospho-N-acetylmuramoyl-pentapeptide-transferase